ncbi:hydroxymethylpyrimidine/phosphomethylpyrimidine kinase [Aquimarina brevivitae]|uniref:hydroxymethylpyrimidine kinase n=1 Tax=Aquimarina brevivitae TaxID=323412 RepID=A0A4Q7PGU8_9FLAO|nr:hydroxymethylpyrimidine/phosphomethylpyrimidine kinase [Aquimarina brevivitae]RZS99605.1 hydroxymethylpyrimidine/phosphomethylpyrimidine kinase [Aquimarina brevivitae]
MDKRPYILTIAGFDPSGGAGVLADIKTFEALKCMGLAVATANTIQNDKTFMKCYWTPIEVIKEQLVVLMKRFPFEIVKIGIVKDWLTLSKIIDILYDYNHQIKIVLDPVLSATAGYSFETSSVNGNRSIDVFEEILNKVYLLTPNYLEIQRLYPKKSIEEATLAIQQSTNVLLKGGHRTEEKGKDELYTKSIDVFTLKSEISNATAKHGSGCILSSAIAAYLGKGLPLLEACTMAKRFTEQRLISNTSLLAYY